MRTEFQEQLRILRETVAEMGTLCEQAIASAAHLLENCEEDLLKQMAKTDSKIDRMQRDIEHQCSRLLLLQQPVAGDLRRISAAMKMAADMERIGDQAADIAELSVQLAGKTPKSYPKMKRMAQMAVAMVTDSVSAFEKEDVALAQKVVGEDDAVDAAFLEIKDEVVKAIREEHVDAAIWPDVLMAAKYFERIADHAVNIAEWVQYCVTGEHESSEHHFEV